MKEALIDLLLNNLTLTISRNLNQCVVSVSGYGGSVEQYLPLDGHLDYALPGCIRYCIEQIKQTA